MMSVAASRKAHRATPASTPEQIDCVIVATVTHLLQTPAIATGDRLRARHQPGRGLRHLGGLRRLLPRPRAGRPRWCAAAAPGTCW